MKSIITFFFLCFITLSFSQDLNGYKYVVVPEKFEAFKTPNQYRLNVTLHGLLSKNNFEAYLTKSKLPEFGLNNPCTVLNAEVINDSNLFVTKVAIQFKNCKDEIVYTSPFGKSRVKKFIVAYNDALRSAASHLESLKYNYNEAASIATNVVKKDTSNDALKAKIEALKQEKEALINQQNTKKEEIEPKTEKGIKAIEATKKEAITENSSTKSPAKFYAKLRQKDGWVDYNVFDEKGVLYFVFYSTGQKDTYLVQESNNDDKMLCFKKDGLWHLVIRNETKMEIKILQIQF